LEWIIPRCQPYGKGFVADASRKGVRRLVGALFDALSPPQRVLVPQLRGGLKNY
jgi:hypothetical protein